MPPWERKSKITLDRAATDGIDGSEVNAGAFVDSGSINRMLDCDVRDEDPLFNKDARNAFEIWRWDGLLSTERGNDQRDRGGLVHRRASCLIPRFNGAILSLEWREALWDKFVTAAPRPRTLSEQQYSDRKLRSRN